MSSTNPKPAPQTSHFTEQAPEIVSKISYLSKNKNTDDMIFETRASFREWLQENGRASEGIWLIFSKTKAIKTITAQEALEEALCHGWIDGQMESIDKDTYKKYFVRRRTKSVWSEKNKALAIKLIKQGLMTQPGQEAITEAKQNGQWENSNRPLITEDQIADFKQLIQPHEPAYTNLCAMSHSIQRTYTGFYLDAKSDATRQTRLSKIIDRLTQNLKPM